MPGQTKYCQLLGLTPQREKWIDITCSACHQWNPTKDKHGPGNPKVIRRSMNKLPGFANDSASCLTNHPTHQAMRGAGAGHGTKPSASFLAVVTSAIFLSQL